MKKILCIILTIMLVTSGITRVKADMLYDFVFTRNYLIGKWNNYFYVYYDIDSRGKYITDISCYQTTSGIGVGTGDIILMHKSSYNTWQYHATCQLKLALAFYIGFDIGKYHREGLIACPNYWEAYPLDDWYGF